MYLYLRVVGIIYCLQYIVSSIPLLLNGSRGCQQWAQEWSQQSTSKRNVLNTSRKVSNPLHPSVDTSVVWYCMVWGTIPGVRCGVTLDFYSRKRTPCASPVMSSSTTTVLLWRKANRSCFCDRTQKELQELDCTEPGVATLALVLI